MRRLLILVAISTLLASIASVGFFGPTRAHAAPPKAPAALTSPNVSAPFSVYSPSGNVTRIASLSDYRGTGAQFFDTHNVPLQLTSIQYLVVAHHSGSDFPFSVRAAKGVRVGGIELAINTHAGTELLAVGIPTPASAAKADALGGTHAGATTASTGAPGLVSPNTSTGDAPLHLIWSDRFNIWVVQVWDILHWQYNGVTVSINSINDYENWDTWTAWYEDGVNRSWGYDYSSGLPVDAWDSTNAYFINDGFCGGNKTFIWVQPSTSAGYNDGSRSWSGNTFTEGCPGALLSWWTWG